MTWYVAVKLIMFLWNYNDYVEFLYCHIVAPLYTCAYTHSLVELQLFCSPASYKQL